MTETKSFTLFPEKSYHTSSVFLDYFEQIGDHKEEKVEEVSDSSCLLALSPVEQLEQEKEDWNERSLF